MNWLTGRSVPLHRDIALDKTYTVVSFGPAPAKWDARLVKGLEMLRHGLMKCWRA